MTTYQDVLVKMIELKRIDQQLSLDELLEDVTSKRSYYRYIKLEAEMPLRIIGLLCSKLNLNVLDLLDFAKTSDFKDFHLARFIRFHRLQLNDAMNQSKETLLSMSLSSNEQALISASTLKGNRYQALHDYLQLEYPLDTLQPKNWMHGPIQHTSFHVFLEYVIEFGYQHLDDLKNLSYATQYLHHVKPKMSDHYINDPLSLFEAYLYEDQREVCELALIRHISNHFFFDQGTPVSTYIKTLEKRFSIHAFQLFKDTFIKTIQ